MIGRKPGRLTGLVAANIAVASLTVGAGPAAQGSGEPVGRPGEWTLGSSVGEGLVLRTPGDRTRRKLFDFVLPSQASQGPETWFLVRLQYVLYVRRDVRINKGARIALAYLGAETNGLTSAQIEVQAVRAKGSPKIYADSAGYVARRPRLRRGGATISGTYFNYLRDGGVRPGRNTFVLDLEQIDGRVVEAVKLLPDSGVVVTPLAPESIRLDAALATRHPVLGQEYDLTFRVTNRDGDAAEDVGVAIEPSHGIEVEGGRSRRVGVLPGESSIRGAFRIRFTERGRQRLVVRASALGNEPSVLVDLRVEERGSSSNDADETEPLPPGEPEAASNQASDETTGTRRTALIALLSLCVLAMVGGAWAYQKRRRPDRL